MLYLKVIIYIYIFGVTYLLRDEIALVVDPVAPEAIFGVLTVVKFWEISLIYHSIDNFWQFFLKFHLIDISPPDIVIIGPDT